MIKVIRYCTSLFAGILIAGTVSAQAPLDTVAGLIRSGDATGLAAHFNQALDIGLPDRDQDYSKAQGERVMKNFFIKYPPTGFLVEENGELGEGNHFMIGNYQSGKTSFQVYIIMKRTKEKWLISKLKFEKE